MAEKIFFDTNPIIYLIEDNELYAEKIDAFVSEKVAENAEFYTSTITDAEFLLKPLNESNHEVIFRYRDFLRQLEFCKVYVSESVAERSAWLRTRHPELKLADSIQLAASLDCGCDIFLTNDFRLRGVTEAHVLLVADMTF